MMIFVIFEIICWFWTNHVKLFEFFVELCKIVGELARPVSQTKSSLKIQHLILKTNQTLEIGFSLK